MFGRSLVTPYHARILEERARLMRSSPTRSEEWVWRALSGSKTGFAFRRQLVIARFIVDFACTKVRLAIEIDGSSHEHREHLDASRDRILADLGWRILRIEENLVFADLNSVISTITRACGAP
jgi:very-short-patch-repair endonuclease